MKIAEKLTSTADLLARSGLCYGHGTDNPEDEAAWLVLHVAGVPLDGSFNDWGRVLTGDQVRQVDQIAKARCQTRMPLAYLLGTAWFAGLEFVVNSHVLVPRSPVAELILDHYQPWLEPARAEIMLDMCTGSGCIAIASAIHLPGLRVDAVDISRDALAVAEMNITRHHLADRVTLIESDLFSAVPEQPYSLIVANPPYVPAGSLSGLPQEYRSEPGLGLASGQDGLDAVLTILLDAPRFLGEDGVLICEVGESEDRLALALPGVPFLWLEFSQGGSGVFVLTRSQLIDARESVAGLIKGRKHVV